MKRSMTRCLILLILLVPVLAASHQIPKPAQRVIQGSQQNNMAIKPRITNVSLKYINGDFVGLDVVGIAFGTPSPTKKLYIDGIKADEMEVVGWTNTKLDVDEEVFFEITGQLVWWDHTYQWSIHEGAAAVSDTFSKRFLLHIESITPSNPAVGSVIEIVGDGLSHAGDLKIGATTAPEILSREMHKIRARVPAMPAGTYAVSIQQGGTTISETKNITVH